ncbi:MAG TPA: LuxR family transcriptional regulator [Actinoplanes sp.]|nr:LuxR family transcriptional regulator [Actinoplanes sp.]
MKVTDTLPAMPAPGHSATPPFVGRQDELQRITALLDGARSGRGDALVLLGETGIGKTALLDRAGHTATGFQVIRCTGSRSETDLPFAAIHQLCLPLMSGSGALRTVFTEAPAPADTLRIGLAVLALLTGAAREQPLLCLVDDAQWLDTASVRTLTFIARRLSCEPVVMLFAQRTPGPAGLLDDLASRRIAGLTDDEIDTLPAARRPIGDGPVLQRLRAEARGNPSGLLQRPVAGGYAAADLTAEPCRAERGFQDRLDGLTGVATLLLTVASADPTGDPALFWAAARRLGFDMPAASTALAGTGLAEVGTRVLFCHPLARSAVYRAAEPALRRAAHRALAEVTDPATAPDRRVWHRAHAGTGPDETIAAELETVRTRGGTAATAAFLELAAAFSVDAGTRVDRTLRAARAHLDAGAPARASHLLTTVDSAGFSDDQHALFDQLRGRAAFTRRSGGDGPRLLLRAAERLAGRDTRRSRENLLDVLQMSLLTGRTDALTDRVLVAAPAGSDPDLLDAGRLLVDDEHGAAVPLLRDLLLEDGRLHAKRPVLEYVFAAALWDPVVSGAGVESVLRAGRESGQPDMVRLGLSLSASHHAFTGDLATAKALTAEEETLAAVDGRPPATCHRLHVAALTGRPGEARELFTQVLDATGGTGYLAANVHWGMAVVAAAQADYRTALAAAEQAVALGDPFLAGYSLPEIVEAAVRCGQPATAAAALTDLDRRTSASATATGLGITAYCRGLVTGDEEHYREAVDLLGASPLLPYRGRAHLLYGEWLRRRGRRRDSREQLTAAQAIFVDTTMEGFAGRTAAELKATGRTTAELKATGGTGRPPAADLTQREERIARLVATGATSKEVAVQLFLSPRTVDAHLRNIFRKTGIVSRRELRRRYGTAE